MGIVMLIVCANERVITLTKNSQLYVRLADVDRLIQQGYLQRID